MNFTRVESTVSVGLPGNGFTIKENCLMVNGLGGELWDGALVLSEYMLQNAVAFSRKAVLELGCGAGLNGLLSAHLDANAVVLTDEVDDLVQINVSLLDESMKDRCKVCPFYWSDPLPAVVQHHMPYDFIIGAEITPHRHAHAALLQALDNVVVEERTQVRRKEVVGVTWTSESVCHIHG